MPLILRKWKNLILALLNNKINLPGPKEGTLNTIPIKRVQGNFISEGLLIPKFINSLSIGILSIILSIIFILIESHEKFNTGIVGFFVTTVLIVVGGFSINKANETGSIIEMISGFVPQKNRSKLYYIFLSWTEKRPRDNAAMGGIIKALTYVGLGHFDFTKYQVDDTKDSSEEIIQNITKALQKSNCSIEVVSPEILYHYWVQFERRGLKNSDMQRVFICLDYSYLSMTKNDNDNIIRINFSDGRSGTINMDKSDMFEIEVGLDNYYYSYSYYAQCLKLARSLSNSLMQNEARFIKMFQMQNNANQTKRINPT